ncbi:MAG: hypothetical protein GSR80_001816 [Desulfurococcales archaeon]|nr:hypothetical protein [Desulfurococcales archaeon]
MPEDLVPCAAVPHHITAFFTPHWEPGDPLRTGSRGAGVVIDTLARACYGLGSGLEPNGPPARALRILGATPRASIHEPLPAARGYATSAAVTLAVALAASAARGASLLAAADAAHTAEVESRTGLGDVLALWSAAGGVAIRLRSGAPSVGLVDYLQAPPSLVLVTASRGEEGTPSLLARLSSEAVREAESRLERLSSEPSFEAFVKEATSYSLRVGWLKGLLGGYAERILSMEGVLGGYAKKRVAVFIVESDRAQDVASTLAAGGFDVRLHGFWRGGGPLVEWINPLQAPASWG